MTREKRRRNKEGVSRDRHFRLVNIVSLIHSLAYFISFYSFHWIGAKTKKKIASVSLEKKERSEIGKLSDCFFRWIFAIDFYPKGERLITKKNDRRNFLMKYSWTQAIFDFFCLRLNKCLYRTREAEAIEREKEKREGKNTKVIYRTLVDIRLCSL